MPDNGIIWENDKDPDQAFTELWNAYSNTLFTSGRLVMRRKGRDMELWARYKAPWKDQTKRARRLLHVEYEDQGTLIGIVTLTHGIWYGVWLEVAYGGKWGIIPKTIDYWGPLFMRDMQSMMNLGLIAG